MWIDDLLLESQLRLESVTLIVVILYSLKVRSHGFWEGLNQMFSINDPFAAGRNPNNQSQRSHLEKISNIVQKLPTDTFVPEEELSKLPISKLKVGVISCLWGYPNPSSCTT